MPYFLSKVYPPKRPRPMDAATAPLGAPAPAGAAAKPKKGHTGLIVGVVVAVVLVLLLIGLYLWWRHSHPPVPGSPGGPHHGKNNGNGHGYKPPPPPVTVQMGEACGSSLSPQKLCAAGTTCSPASDGKCYLTQGTAPDCGRDYAGSSMCSLVSAACAQADRLPSQAEAAKVKGACYDFYRACYPPTNPAAASSSTCADAKAAALSVAESVGGPAAESAIIKAIEEYIKSHHGS